MNLPRVGKYGVNVLTRCVLVLLLLTIVHIIVVKVTQWSGHLTIRGSPSALEIPRTSLSSLSELEIETGVELKRSIVLKSGAHINSSYQ